RLGAVGAVDEVVLHLEAEVAADRAGRRLERVRRTDDLARGLVGLVALEDAGDQRAAGDEVDELAEERALAVLVVVLLGEVGVGVDQLEGDDLQALLLEAGEDLAAETAPQSVRLHQDQGSSQGRWFWRPWPLRGVGAGNSCVGCCGCSIGRGWR